MRIILLLVTGIASLIILSKLLGFDKMPKFVLGFTFIVGIGFASLGAYEGCADGWASTSIGRSGACSYHGGVKTHLNIYGWSGLAISSIIIFAAFSNSEKKG